MSSEPGPELQIRGLAREHDPEDNRHVSRGIDYDHAGGPIFRDDSYEEASWSSSREPNRYRDWDREDVDRPRSRSRRPERRPRGYRDRDGEVFRSSSPPRRRYESPPRRPVEEPSRELMMHGIPSEIKESDIAAELEEYHGLAKLDDVRVIRDRSTGTSRGFGFLRFSTIEQAKDFLERNLHTLYLYGKSSEGRRAQSAKVSLSFSRERANRDELEEAGWRCISCDFLNYSRRSECKRCHVPWEESAAERDQEISSKPENVGDSDVSPDNTASQYLLFRSLGPNVTEDLLHKGATKLYESSEPPTASAAPNAKVSSTSAIAQAGAPRDSIRRVFLVRDRHSDESWRFGFVEFKTVELAQAAIAKFKSLPKFTIASKPVMVDYIHAGVFVPVAGDSGSKQHKFSFTATTNPSLRVTYWDKGAYAKELPVSMERIPTPNPPQQQQQQSGPPQKQPPDQEAKSKKRKAEPANATAPKKPTTMPAHLQRWTERHNELHGASDTHPPDKPPDDTSGPSPAPDNTPPPAEPDETRASQTYIDQSAGICYLCRTRLTNTTPTAHARASQRHATLFRSADKRAAAVAFARQKGFAIAEAPEPDSATDSASYRDRAAERRTTHSQPSKPQPPPPPAFGGFKMPSAAQKKAEPEAGAAPDPPSKGASMLLKMGYAPGAGLGASGEGATAPVATAMYAAGVGLGADGGRVGDAVEEAERATRGDYADFAQKTRDRARERFERM